MDISLALCAKPRWLDSDRHVWMLTAAQATPKLQKLQFPAFCNASMMCKSTATSCQLLSPSCILALTLWESPNLLLDLILIVLRCVTVLNIPRLSAAPSTRQLSTAWRTTLTREAMTTSAKACLKTLPAARTDQFIFNTRSATNKTWKVEI